MAITDRLMHAWNAFMNKDPTTYKNNYYSDYGTSYRPDTRMRLTVSNDRSIVTSVYNKMAMDAAAIEIKHVRLDENKRYISDIDSGLNECLNVEANMDQTGRAFRQDVYYSMFDEGVIAIAPTTANNSPIISGNFDIESMRVGRIDKWHPNWVTIEMYDEITGKKKKVDMPKSCVSIVENPLYPVMNEPNGVMQRLIRKLNILDAIDEQSGAGKLDLIIQLPYVIKTEGRRKQAEQRRADIENQLKGSKYGIAYTDGTEHITQLNRPVENNLMKQIEYLTSMLYSQLGITQGILDGTADEKTFTNYYTRTIEPIVAAVVDEMKRKFLTKTARTQGQSLMVFRSPFKLTPVTDLANIADTLTRNEIMTSNEIRQEIGLKPSSDPKADQLVNSNISQANQLPTQGEEPISEEEYQSQMNELSQVDSDIDNLESQLKEE